MAFKRADEPSLSEKEAKLVDELVRKTLDINPDLRRGRDTQEVLDELRGKAIAKAKETTPAPNEPLTFSGKDPRLQTIDIFMRDKALSYPKIVSDLETKLEALKKEIDQARSTTVREITELVGVLILSGAQPPAVMATLKAYRDLLSVLKTTEVEIVNSCSNKKR